MVGKIPRVLQVLPALKSGGVEKATLDWAQILCQQAPTFVTSAGGGLVKHLEASGVAHLPLPLDKKSPWALWLNAKALCQVIKEHNIQLVHVRSRAPAWSALWAARRMKVPFITTYHGVYNAHNRLKRFYNSVMARGDHVIAISEYVARHIQSEHGHLKPNVVVIPEGIDTDVFDPTSVSCEQVEALKQQWGVPPNKFLIMLPGRLTRWKGQGVLVGALKGLSDLPVHVVFLGSDQGRTDYSDRLRQETKDLPVTFVPSCEYMPTAYAAADLVLSCSIEPEAFGRVTAEALSMARPYIGTDLGATPELCLEGQTGFLIPANDFDALAVTIRNLFALAMDEKTRMGLVARQHISDNFSLKQMTAKTLDLYQLLIG
ncbi:glycosyltransferase family 4 protein [Candidatus Finniella inopinata]|uniref:Glycosyltransferase n=1 Tax=Candidatus Finniella inopinata TaxID=1696036 RepID=A0A4Q7DKA2_9PROT|nr:glycosyltransferase family 4 protein [Candidatus Finniella inopinata]RZI46810.1 glycosyltransferase [Candidatus Finniella inopinata]